MPFDGITIRALCQELHERLVDARIDKIFQPEKDEVTLSIRTKTGSCRLLLSANPRWARSYLASTKKENPSNPPAFCMLLRKYLEGGKIKAIHQCDFERIMYIDIEAMDDFREWKMKRLICEFTGRHSNIVLINPETNTIIDAIKRFSSEQNSYREVMPGRLYVEPPDQAKLNPLKYSFETMVEQMWNQSPHTELSQAVFNSFSGISPFSARQICYKCGLDPSLPVEQCGEFEFRMISQQLEQMIISLADTTHGACVAFNGGQTVEFAPYPLMELGPRVEIITTSSINEACDRYYQNKMGRLKLDSIKVNLSRNMKGFLDKAYKKQFHLEGDEERARENEKYKDWGELITAYAHELHKGDLRAEFDDFTTGEPVSIDLDPRYTPIQNAQRYFKIYNKSRSALRHLESLKAQNHLEISYLESVLLAISQAEDTQDIEEIVEELEGEGYLKEHSKRKKARGHRSQPRHFMSSDGLEILVGRNNRQNDLLSIKQAASGDLWLHTKEIAGTHVIVKLPRNITNIDSLPDSTLEEAAILAAYFSKAEQSSKVEVDYTFRSNLRKPNGSKPGMVVYENYWTINVDPHDKRLSILLEQQAVSLK
ncbi:MAG: NFACT family protein [Deltaproteobacteria bacterium]